MTSPACVLVVDDDPDTRDLFAAALTARGFHVKVAASGEEAIRRLCEPGDTPDLILLDVVMPGMDGLEFRRIQRQYLRWAAIPVVAVTGHAAPGSLEALDAAATLVKPVAVADLLAAVERCCRRREPAW